MPPLDLFRGSKAASDIAKNFTAPYEEERKFQRELQLAQAKSSIISPKDQAMTDYYKAQTNKLNNPQSETTGVYSWDPNTKTMIKEGSVPKGSVIRNTLTPEDFKARKKAQYLGQIEPLVASGENVLKTSVGAFKQMAANNPMGAGRGAGLLNWIGGKTGMNPAVNAYNGLKVETATELAKIANPSGRGGPELQKEFEKLLPNTFTTWDEFANKFHYAAQNAFARQAAYSGGEYDPSDYEERIQAILDTPAFQQMSVGGINPIQQAAKSQSSGKRASKYNVGDTKMYNGVLHRKSEDGKWYPVK